MLRSVRGTFARGVVAAWLGLGAIAGAGCSTPTLPLPPPAALRTTPPDADGMVTVEGDVLESAYVFVLNEDLERGVIVRADDRGHFVARIEAAVGHSITVWQRIGVRNGEPRGLSVPAP